MIRQILLLE